MDVYAEIVKLREAGRRGALATIVGVRGSIPAFETAKMLVRDDGSIVGTIGGGCVEAEVWQAAKEVMQTEKVRSMRFDLNSDPKYQTGLICGGTLEIFVEPVLPVPQIYLFGAGHVSQSIYKVAKMAGFDVTVADDRDAYANPDRFPAARAIHVADYDDIWNRVTPDEQSYLVIVTRGHAEDMHLLREVLRRPVPARYLGMIGSERKFLSIRKTLEAEGVPDAAFGRVMSPVGLDIGAVTPEEIGVAVVAEMIAVRRGAMGTLPHLAWNAKDRAQK